MPIYHKHHIVPKHMGGSDDPSNLVELTIEEHAEAHLRLWEEHGIEYDLIAYRCLSGQISLSEASHHAWKTGSMKGARAPKSQQWKQQASERMKQKYSDPEERRKQAEKSTGKNYSEATRNQMSESAKKAIAEGRKSTATYGMRGKSHSEETKQRMKAAWERRRSVMVV